MFITTSPPRPALRARRRTAVILGMCLAAIAPALAPASPATAAALGYITGKVMRASGGAFANAHVFGSTLDGTESFDVTADANGAYRVAAEPGTYCISFGPNPGNVVAEAFNDKRHCLDGATTLTVVSAGTWQDVNAVLHLGDVSGVVRGANGTPVNGASVHASQVFGSARLDTATDAFGVYMLRNLVPGTYCVAANDGHGTVAPGGPPECEDGGRRVEVVADTPVGGVDFMLGEPQQFGAISGHVTYAGGPVAGRLLRAYGADGREYGSATAAADGSYSIVGLEPGSYCVRAEVQATSAGAAAAYPDAVDCDAATPVQVGAAVVSGIDLALRPGGSIAGTVTSGSAIPLPYANVDVESFGVAPDSSMAWFAEIDTAIGGAYEVKGLPTGDYCIRFSDPQQRHAAKAHPNGASCSDGAQPVHVSAGATTAVDAQLGDGGTISGKVAVPNGVDFTLVTVAAFGPAGWSQYVRPDATGTYTVKYLTPGTYCVSFDAPPGTDVVSALYGSAERSCTPAATSLDVSAGATSTANVTLESGGSVSGWVVTAAGVPVAGADVRVVPVGAPAGAEGVGQTYGAHSDGSFALRGVRPGTYCVIYDSFEHGLGTTALGNVASCDAAGALRVTVSAGQHISGVRITPALVGYVAGTVRAADGRSFDGTRIEVFPIGATTPIASTIVQGSADGDSRALLASQPALAARAARFDYQFELPAGTYCVRITPPAGAGLAGRSFAGGTDCTSGFTPVVVKLGEVTAPVDVVLDVIGPPAGGGGGGGSHGYVPLDEPRRVLDTRPGATTFDGVDAGTGAIEAGGVHEVVVAGRAGVPVTAASVVLNVTAVDAGGAGFVTVWPCGVERPLASNVNYAANGTRPNSVIAKVGVDGKVCVFSSQPIEAVVDVAGYFPTADDFLPLPAPGRLTDTRSGSATVDGADAGAGVLAGGSVHEVVVAGRAGVPSGASTAVLNVTAVDASAAGFATVWPCGTERPLASSVNFAAGGTAPNSVIAKIGAAGKVCVFASQALDLVVDVAGFFPTADAFVALPAPGRLTDTRPGTATIDGVDAGAGSIEADGTHEVMVSGRAGVPGGAASVVLNVTAVDAAAPGFATVWPCGVPRPLASNLNFAAGDTVPNSVIAKVGAGGKVCVYSSQHIDAVVDVIGWFAG